jgi:hypothetical protein
LAWPAWRGRHLFSFLGFCNRRGDFKEYALLEEAEPAEKVRLLR